MWQVPWSTGTECVAKYNFQTATEQDLPFCKGDLLTIIGVTRVSVYMIYASPTVYYHYIELYGT